VVTPVTQENFGIGNLEIKLLVGRLFVLMMGQLWGMLELILEGIYGLLMYLDEAYRGKSVLETHSLTRKLLSIATTAANKAGLGLYRNIRWFRYYDLVHYVED
jgi:hypothetical protein